MKNFPLSGRRQRAFSLTEMAIVLGVIGLILAAIWTAASSANQRNKVDAAVQELQTTAQNMVTLYQNRALPAPATFSAGPRSTIVSCFPCFPRRHRGRRRYLAAFLLSYRRHDQGVGMAITHVKHEAIKSA